VRYFAHAASPRRCATDVDSRQVVRNLRMYGVLFESFLVADSMEVVLSREPVRLRGRVLSKSYVCMQYRYMRSMYARRPRYLKTTCTDPTILDPQIPFQDLIMTQIKETDRIQV